MHIPYPYLPSGRVILYVPKDNQYMREAFLYSKENSSDRMHPTGAVVVKDGKIIGRGANQNPLKIEWLKKLHQKGVCVRKFFRVKSGEKYWLCPGCVKNSDHAESRAVRDALKNGQNPEGADLYLWGHWWCCQPCWQAMIKAGIKDVYLLEGSERLFDKNHSEHIIGRQFDLLA